MLRAAWELVGWDTLTRDAQDAARYGGVLGFGTAMATYALFGFYPTGRRWSSRRKRKRGKKRRQR